jgi:hypothetical protein
MTFAAGARSTAARSNGAGGAVSSSDVFVAVVEIVCRARLGVGEARFGAVTHEVGHA